MRQWRTWSLESERTGVQTPARTFSTPWSKASQSFNVLHGMELGTVSISGESYSEDPMHVKQHRACEHSLNVITIRNKVSYYKAFTYQDSTQIHHLWRLSWLAIPSFVFPLCQICFLSYAYHASVVHLRVLDLRVALDPRWRRNLWMWGAFSGCQWLERC